MDKLDTRQLSIALSQGKELIKLERFSLPISIDYKKGPYYVYLALMMMELLY